ncbi:hypothetical protein [Variovorax rhizosphaerae]|uniref:Copper-binding protein n=1 Tax=Variovorax rhizosphaerae TaxID=1836200 RepID=A0ABU8WFZ6_9BURK
MRYSVIVLAGVLALSQAAFAQDTKPAKSAEEIRATGGELVTRATVIELDKARRIAVLKGPDGTLSSFEVPESVKNFDQVRVGDQLVLRYVAAVATQLEPVAKNNGIRERIETTAEAKAPAGGLPGSGAARTVEVLAVVQSIDRKARTAKLRGVSRTVTVKIPDDMDVSKMKAGSEVRAVFTEAAVLSVERVAKKK